MNISTLLSALHTLCSTPIALGAQLTGDLLVRLGMLCLDLFILIGRHVHAADDPRLTLAHATLVEKMSQEVHQQQRQTVLDLEVRGAAGLSVPTLDAVRHGSCDFATEAQYASGRAPYRSAADLLAAWLGVDYFEANRRLHEAHLLLGRRNAQGEPCAPRFAQLGQQYQRGIIDRRTLSAVACSLDKLEPKDTTFDGIPTTATALAEDGQTLEAHAAQLLERVGLVEARKQINTLVRTYKDAHSEQLPPPLGMFAGPVIRGVHTFTLRTTAVQAEELKSLRAQSSRRRTKQAAKAAAKAAAEAAAAAHQQSEQDCAEETNGSDAQPIPEWLRSDQPMPEWAQDPDANPEHDAASNASAAADGQQDGQQDGQPGEDPDIEDVDDDDDADGIGLGDDETSAAEQDGSDLSGPERWLNAVMGLISEPPRGGERKPIVPRVVVYMWLSDLQDLAKAHGITANGVDIPPGELRQLLAKSLIIPIVLGGNSQPLDVGRSRRYHTGYIRLAIMARDRGCIVPGCTTPPDRVEIDHYKLPWSQGGTTSVASGAALCCNEHHGRHAGDFEVVDIDGLPHVILPEHIDPERKPRRNTYWGALQLGDCPQSTSR